MRSAWTSYLDRIGQRSARIPPALSRLTTAFAFGWAGIFMMFAAFRTLAAPPMLLAELAGSLALYSAIALAPLAGYHLTRRAMLRDRLSAPIPGLSSLIGRWRPLDPAQARRHPLFGPAGFMASMLIGLLLNVVMRGLEFLIAFPPIGGSGPTWAHSMFVMMAAGTALTSFLYMAVFAMALRSIPLFPRMLVFAWLADLFVQLAIANQLGAMGTVPAQIAEPLSTVLYGNIQKVLISAFVWVPYLTLSDRVNVTYRNRVSVNG